MTRPRLPVATSVYGAITDLGLAVGPALMAGFLLIASPETILAGNALTFALSALILARLRFGEAPAAGEPAAAPARSRLRRETESARSGWYAACGPCSRLRRQASSSAGS